MLLRRLVRACQSFVRAISPFIVGLLCFTVTSTAWADSQTDRFQAYAREQLQKPHRSTPYPCSDFWAGSKDSYVLDMAPWAAAAGLRRGDRPVAYGGTPLAA
jgi:hypothetical protein